MKKEKRNWLRWMLAVGVGAVLAGGLAAAAREPQCWKCEPCGCSGDGGAMMCCYGDSC